MQRFLRHLSLATLTAGAMLVAFRAGPEAAAGDRISLITSWLCMGFLSAALLLGPLSALRTGRPLLNHLPRRDLGIWGALTGLIHFGLAFRYSMNLAYVAVFIEGAAGPPSPLVRRALYQWSVIAGILIAVLFLLLLALSSNWSLRRLGPIWWKRLQRSSYAAFLLSAGHGFAFQLIESRATWLVALLMALTAAVIIGQVAGIVTVRRTVLRGASPAAPARG